MLKLTDISKTFVHQRVLDTLSLQIGQKSRIGLIGRNGCGKSTLLKILMGQLEPDSGTIYRAPGLKVNCLTQEPQITPGNTLEQEVRTVFASVNALMAEEALLLEGLEAAPQDEQMKKLDRLHEVHQDLARLDAYDIDAKINKMITGLGFSLDEMSRPVEQFSGGWQMRINLAKVLLEGADILLLDEPTNHLDLEALEWLENFLKDYPGGLVIVSHDRSFLDRIVTEVAEVELGHLTLWPGNYSQFITQKADYLEREAAAVDRQQKELAKQTAFVERFRASATKSTQAKSREKQLDKIERLEAPKTDNRRMTVRFPVPQSSGKEVLKLEKIAKRFGNNVLFQDLNAELHRHQRVFLLGANGCGKTTLFRLIMELEPADTGNIKQGHHVKLGYFSQNQLETLEPQKTVFDTLHDARPDMTQTEIRGLLGRFLFTGDQVFKAVEKLSGGEKSKLALAKLMLSGPNMLLLDEPTNHMDIPAKEVLEEAFLEYDGSILCISHDRYFIQRLATHIWEIHQGQLIQYDGNYDYYLEKRDEFRARKKPSLPKAPLQEPTSPSTSQAKSSSPLKERRDIEKQIIKIEKEIIKLESGLKTHQADLLNPNFQNEYEKLHALTLLISETEKQLAQKEREWEHLTETLAELEK